jgi:hypothetical protein
MAPTPTSLGYLAFREGAGHLRVGVRALGARDWLEVDDDRDAQLALKQELLRSRGGELLAWLPATEAAAREVLDAIVDDLHAHHGIEVEPDPSVGHPIDAAGRLVQEDLCLHVVRDGVMVLAAASVCFPAKWSVRDKIGKPVRAVHGPVPGYDEALGSPVDRVLAGLSAGRGLWRINWSVDTSGALCQPGPQRPADPTTLDPAALWLRVERQTLRRFPVHGSVLFTIRTYQQTLASLAEHADACRDLAATIRGLPPEMLAYKDLTEIGDVVATWLERAGPDEPDRHGAPPPHTPVSP